MTLTEEDIKNPDVLGEKLITLAEIVIRKHFYASLREKDDLVSVGVLKALTLIEKGEWAKSKGAFHNYIYSGMRNDMHNYLYHQNKFSLVDDESMPESGSDDKYFDDGLCVDYTLIHSVCIRFENVFGSSLESKVIRCMQELGISIQGMRDNLSETHDLVYCNNVVQDEYGKDAEDDIIGRIIGIILWKRKDIIS